MEHSKVVGGSSAARVLACPRSIDLVAEAPPQTESEYAAEGTALHHAMEFIFEHDREPSDVLGMTFNGYEMTEELIGECIAPAFTAVDKMIGDKAFLLETRAPFPGIEGAFGTADVIAVTSDGNELHMADYKFGGGVRVEALHNSQLKFYLACLRRFMGIRPKIITAQIVQPRLNNYGVMETTNDELDAFEVELRHAVQFRDDKPLATGAHCRWCAALATCPAHVEQAREVTAHQELSKSLPELLILADKLEAWIGGVRQQAKDTLAAGHPVQGKKLVRSRKRRAWADDAAADKWLARHRVKVGQRRKTSVISPAQAEKLLAARGVEFPGHLLDGTPSDKLVMVDETDRREAIIPGKGQKKMAAIQRMMENGKQ